MKHANPGFTLIEMMVVVAIIAILAALAYPSYERYAYRARRADAKEMIVRVQSAQERFYTNFNVYAASITAPPPGGLGFGTTSSEKGYYTVTTANGLSGNNQSYQITATPVVGTVQDKDACVTLSITEQGVKSATGPQNNGACW